jgi:hypothetical protein
MLPTDLDGRAFDVSPRRPRQDDHRERLRHAARRRFADGNMSYAVSDRQIPLTISRRSQQLELDNFAR